MDPQLEPAASRAAAPADLPAAERRALRERDADALALFYDAYFDQVYGYVRRLLREEHLAEDVTQDIFMHIHRALPSYDPERPLRPWVFTIATNKVRDHWRSRRHREMQHERSADDGRGGLSDVSAHHGPGDAVEAGELSEVVAQAIDELPEILKTTLMLRYYEGLSFAEIGAMVDRNEVAVRKRYSRALEELRLRLRKHLGADGGALDA